MKNSSKIAFTIAALGLPSAALIAFAAFSHTAPGEFAGSVLAIAGLQLVALSDAGRARRAVAKPAAALAPAAPDAIVCDRRPSYGLRRRECSVG